MQSKKPIVSSGGLELKEFDDFGTILDTSSTVPVVITSLFSPPAPASVKTTRGAAAATVVLYNLRTLIQWLTALHNEQAACGQSGQPAVQHEPQSAPWSASKSLKRKDLAAHRRLASILLSQRQRCFTPNSGSEQRCSARHQR
jgi:hypothetical protein